MCVYVCVCVCVCVLLLLKRGNKGMRNVSVGPKNIFHDVFVLGTYIRWCFLLWVDGIWHTKTRLFWTLFLGGFSFLRSIPSAHHIATHHTTPHYTTLHPNYHTILPPFVKDGHFGCEQG